MKNNIALDAFHYGMGTQISHRVYGSNAKEALNAAQGEAKRLEDLLSRFIPQSDVGRINASAGKVQEKISKETFCVAKSALEFTRLSDGLFNAAIGPLVDLWDYKHSTKPPSKEKIVQVLSLINAEDFEINSAQMTAGLKRKGQSIDFGGIGKGFASDRFIKIFTDYGITSAFSNIGGNVSTLGSKPDGKAWRVGIKHPRQDGLIGAVAVNGKAVVTSGDYERFFIDNLGRRFCHILNPLTGYPARSGLISATVIADSAMTADALSTALFVAGIEKGLEIIKKCDDVQVILIDDILTIYVSKELNQKFDTITDISVRYI